MAGAFELAPAIPALPFVAFLVALAFGQYMPKKGAIAGIAATGGSLLLSFWALLTVLAVGDPYQETLYVFAAGAPFELTFGVLIDQLSTLMLVVVSLISLLSTSSRWAT